MEGGSCDFLVLSSLCLLFPLEILLPLVIGVSQILFPTATLMSQDHGSVYLLGLLNQQSLLISHHLLYVTQHRGKQKLQFNFSVTGIT